MSQEEICGICTRGVAGRAARVFGNCQYFSTEGGNCGTIDFAYIAQPYSRKWKFNAFSLAAKKLVELTQKGYVAFSPITHSHPTDGLFDFEEYMKIDLAIMHALATSPVTKSFTLFLLKGWEESEGCKQEHKYARKLMNAGLPVSINYWVPV